MLRCSFTSGFSRINAFVRSSHCTFMRISYQRCRRRDFGRETEEHSVLLPVYMHCAKAKQDQTAATYFENSVISSPIKTSSRRIAFRREKKNFCTTFHS